MSKTGPGTEFMNLTDYSKTLHITVKSNHNWGQLFQDNVCEAKCNMHRYDHVREIREGFLEEVMLQLRAKA